MLAAVAFALLAQRWVPEQAVPCRAAHAPSLVAPQHKAGEAQRADDQVDDHARQDLVAWRVGKGKPGRFQSVAGARRRLAVQTLAQPADPKHPRTIDLCVVAGAGGVEAALARGAVLPGQHGGTSRRLGLVVHIQQQEKACPGRRTGEAGARQHDIKPDMQGGGSPAVGRQRRSSCRSTWCRLKPTKPAPLVARTR